MKIEVGKKYIQRDGSIWGPAITYSSIFGEYKFRTADLGASRPFRTENGRVWSEGIDPSPDPGDLVAEYVEPVAANNPVEPVALIEQACVQAARERVLNTWAREIHAANAHFYHDINTGAPLDRNVGELIALIHSEVTEMLEGVRKNKMDDKLPHRKQEEVEAADIFIRLLDYCGYRGLDLGGAVIEKLAFNKTRQDHTNEARRAEGGKRF